MNRNRIKQLFEGLFDESAERQLKQMRREGTTIPPIESGTEKQEYFLQNRVTEASHHYKRPGTLVRVWNNNGYWWYGVRFDDMMNVKGYKDKFYPVRQKDLRLYGIQESRSRIRKLFEGL